MKIGGLQKVTLVDYPGKVACTVFLSGCNFKCPFCYSRELVLPEYIQNQPELSEKDFFSFLKEKRGLIDACVICGGEPTINPDLKDFIKKIKDLGFLVKLDTNGYLPDKLKELIDEKLIDYIAMDIKACFDDYSKATGINVDVSKIKESIELIKNSGIDYEFRTTIVPTIHTKESIIQMAKDIGRAKKYFLQAFHGEKETINPELSKLKSFPEEELKEIIKEVGHLFKVVKIR
jgi:pyruvate formate lyase activating enzyme